ncbi:MAG: NAD(P)-dependent oxidoreductase [Methylobacterium sp.]|nr:MAG: NAD(P)-dependent oxidoreductase [Methylobacterium sp.]
MGAVPGDTPVALVTGGSRGIGRACALGLAEDGYDVVINYVGNRAAADAVAAGVVARQRRALVIQGDVGSEPDVLRMFGAVDGFGRLAVLVNNAGVVDVAARVDEMSLDRLTRMMRINVIGAFLCAREAVKRMSTRHGGQGGAIINIGSVAADLGSPAQYVDYAASKGAIDSMTIGLGREVATEGVRVNAVRPGLIKTDIHASGGIPDRVERLAGLVPMQRGGSAEEIADSVRWLASPKASYVVGSLITVSGGR